MASASEVLEGSISFRRRSSRPCICVKTPEGEMKWVNIIDIDGKTFEQYRGNFNTTLLTLRKDSIYHQLYDDLLKQKRGFTTFIPHPHERELMKQMFSHLPDDLKRRLLIEYSHTVIGESWCHVCMNLSDDKKKCLHYACQGMCADCYLQLDDTCPACHRAQEIDCPICQESKTAEELHTLAGCHHSVCFKCFTNASLARKPLLKCPICRVEF